MKKLAAFTRRHLQLICCVSMLTVVSLSAAQQNTMTTEDAKNYFKQFGYMDSEMSRELARITEDDPFVSAVKSFQRMASINVTGVVNDETVRMMQMSRCGVKDQLGMGNIAKRRRRYAVQGSKWPKGNIVYKYVGRTTPDLPETVVRSEISKAFQAWTGAVPGLTFSEGILADIEIRFVAGDHGDSYPFDGRGKTLAHAFFPQKGHMHFDEDEDWTSEKSSGTNLLQVAIHELGHSLGLDHSDVKEAIMAPFYRGYVENVKLHTDDIAGIRYLYPDRLNIMQNDFCMIDSGLNAIVAINTTLFAFSGSQFVKLDMNGIVTGYPKSISSVWRDLPSDIDTAVYWSTQETSLTAGSHGTLYFFKGSQVWRYTVSNDLNDFSLNSGYPKKLSAEFEGLPDRLSAAFIWSGNGKPYFINGSHYFRVEAGRVPRGYPRRLSAWSGLPRTNISTVFSYQSTGRTYFVSESKYYRFNDRLFRVDAGYPKSLSQCWFGCPSSGPKDCEHTMMQEMSEGGRQFLHGQDDHSAAGTVVATTFALTALVGLSSVLLIL